MNGAAIVRWTSSPTWHWGKLVNPTLTWLTVKVSFILLVSLILLASDNKIWLLQGAKEISPPSKYLSICNVTPATFLFRYLMKLSWGTFLESSYSLIKVYVPCILIVILSWVSFWIHREATSDRVGLCITTVLTLSTISLDSRTDLPKVRYATALDWFLLMSFFYCIATLLEFAGVHYFTKVGSGEIPISDDEDEWENVETTEEIGGNINHSLISSRDSPQRLLNLNNRIKNSIICPIYNEAYHPSAPGSHMSTMERTTQTEPPRKPRWLQFWLCFVGNDAFRKQRAREATSGSKKHVNSVSLIDRTARIIFPGRFIGQCQS